VFPVGVPDASDTMELFHGDPNLAAAVKACYERVLPSLEPDARSVALDLLANCSTDVRMKVGRVLSSGSCFFESVAALFTDWPVERQKSVIISAAESSPSVMTAILKELAYPTFTFDRDVSVPPPKRSIRIANKANKPTVISLCDEDDVDDSQDEDYCPSESSEDSPREARHKVNEVIKSKNKRQVKETRVGEDKPECVSIAWGFKLNLDKPKLLSLLSKHHIRAPKPSLVKAVKERKRQGCHFHLILHDTAALSNEWRQRVVGVPGITIKKWCPRDQRPASTAKPKSGESGASPNASLPPPSLTPNSAPAPSPGSSAPSSTLASSPGPAGTHATIPTGDNWLQALSVSISAAIQNALRPIAQERPVEPAARHSCDPSGGRPRCQSHRGCHGGCACCH
jgi:hypothetical protein